MLQENREGETGESTVRREDEWNRVPLWKWKLNSSFSLIKIKIQIKKLDVIENINTNITEITNSPGTTMNQNMPTNQVTWKKLINS